jgi:hypothetical protein
LTQLPLLPPARRAGDRKDPSPAINAGKGNI